MAHNEFQIQDNEQILLMIRKHWFVFLQHGVGVLLAGLLPVIVGSFAIASLTIVTPLVSSLFLFFVSTWLLICWIGIAAVWTRHYLDLWVITDRRIVYAEQVRLFVREVTTLPLERVQDATVRYDNIIETLLDFGTLRVQSAGAVENEIVMHGIPNPNEVKRFILGEVDRYSPQAHHPHQHNSAHEALGGH